MRTPGWPATLVHEEIRLRPLRRSDSHTWQEVRRRNLAWLARWDATLPVSDASRINSFGALVRASNRLARQGAALPFALEVDGAFAGQVTVSNIVRGSGQMATLGYWLDRQYAGRAIMPRAVAMVMDHCFGPVGLHRVEVSVRPENTNSLRVVEKLGLPEVGLAVNYLHIDGEWRDHRMHAMTQEQVPRGGMLRYVLKSLESH